MKKLWLMLFLLAALLTAGLLFLRDAAMFYHGPVAEGPRNIMSTRSTVRHLPGAISGTSTRTI